MNNSRIFFFHGKRYYLPWGFHVVNDLLPVFIMGYEANAPKLSKQAKIRLKWIEYYKKHKNVSQTCRYFGVSRKTFYVWLKRCDLNNPLSLEDKDKTPKGKRQRAITPEQESRIVALRKKRIRYGKIKLAKRYKEIYGESISSWQIQRTIEKYKLYYNPTKTKKIAKKRKQAIKKKRITELQKKPRSGYLICLDVIVIYYKGMKRYIFTAIDSYAKIAYARMYTSKSSLNAKDFLYRLLYLLDGEIENIQNDNGSEFHGMFLDAIQKLDLGHYWSRVKTPKDNPVNERFNRTLQEEFMNLGNFHPDPEYFNSKLTEWLVEYNFHRPHQTLNYETPIAFTCGKPELLPMYSSSTASCLF
jgi:transposase InsO family protein